MRRALITGIGMISPLGEGRATFFDNLIEGRSAISAISGFDTTLFNSHLGGEVHELQTRNLSRPKRRGLNRTTKFLTAAIKLAVDDAGLTPEEISASGVVVGTAFGNSAHAITYSQKLFKEGPDEMFPLDAMDMPSNSSVNFISVFFGFRDFARTISAGFTSRHDALGNALQLIRRNRAKRVIVAGMEQLSPELYTLLYQRGLLAREKNGNPECCQPFDRRRSGFVLSEGCYALVIEDDQIALSRNAIPIAELTGFANGFIGSSKLPPPKRLERVSAIVKASLTSASAHLTEIDLVYASANGANESDLLDAKALNRVFWDHNPAICAVKAQLGEAFGASGAMQASAAALCLVSGRNPPFSLPEEPDPRCGRVTEIKIPLVESPQKVIIEGLDIAGSFSCLVLEKYRQDNPI